MGAIEKQVAITLASVLALVVLGTGYLIIEPFWRDQRQMEMTAHSAELGRALFETQGCVTCHLQTGYGVLQGGVGWPLNTTQNQQGNNTELAVRHELLYRTIDRGRGPIMAPYGRENGGPLNSEQIDNIVTYIQYGHWPVAPVAGASSDLVKAGAAGAAGATAGSRGAQLFQSNGCVGCHQIQGQGGVVGPNLTNIGTVAGTRIPGMSAEEYINQSITNPNSFIVQGYQPGVMPTTFNTLPPADLVDLNKYLMEQK